MDHALFVAPAHAPIDAPRPAPWRRAHVLVPTLVTALAVLAGGVGAVVDLTSAEGVVSARPAAATSPAAPAAPAQAPPAPAAAAPAGGGPGYRILRTDGAVTSHGSVSFEGSAAGVAASPTVGIAHAADPAGYWVASADGGVFSFGPAPFLGSAAGVGAHPVVDIAATPSGNGYWLVAKDGGVFTFGDAAYFGSGPEIALPAKIVSLARTKAGDGYWLVSSDGGVFAFGQAAFLGSLGDQPPVNAPIIDLVPTPSGAGYYLVGADGGVFTFGDAAFHGSASNEQLNRPIVDMALSPGGSGYWLLSGDGGVFSYGDAPFLGAPLANGAGGRFSAIAAGIGFETPASRPEVPLPAPAEPEPATAREVAPVRAAAPVAAPPARKPARGSKEPQLDGQFGWDISYPQCGGQKPEGEFAYSIIGVNGGRAFKYNKCLAEQWKWAREHGGAGIYVNVHFPRSHEELAKGATSDRQPDCGPGALSCVAYNFGLNGLRDSLAYARSQAVDAPFVWLDVEQLNYWNPDPALNAVVLRGAVDAAREAGLGVGVYSTPYQYKKISGDEQLQVPVWSAGANGPESVDLYCRERGFGGGRTVLVQLLPHQFDPNFACPGAGAMSQYFRMP